MKVETTTTAGPAATAEQTRETSLSAAADLTAAPRNRAPGNALRREIFRKSEDKCALCGSHHALEIDHHAPFALGGLTISENLRVLCRNCNARESIKVFGLDLSHMETNLN